MKLLHQSGNGFHYVLSQQEAFFLRLLVQQFPLADFAPVTVSKTESRAVEREKLLNESLAAHRNELKQKAEHLVSEEKFKIREEHLLFHVNLEGREILLQVLNDVRVESWQILGEPENPDKHPLDLPKEKIRYHQFMQLAGYFEYVLLNLEADETT